MFVSTTGILARPTSGLPTYSMCGRSNWTWNDVTNPTTGKVWMDRNLGANRVATSSTDAQAYGMTYQWGRLSDNHQCVNRYAGDGVSTSLTTSTQSTTDVPGNSLFVINVNNWRNPFNDNLWQGVNGVNNPCPSGYRIATMVEFQNEWATWSSQNSAGGFASVLKLTMGGYRSNSGNMSSVGANGFYTTSTIIPNGGSISYMLMDSGVGQGYTNRANGLTVRCIKN
jgi:uncharacterized protein (TIGR02145 family)